MRIGVLLLTLTISLSNSLSAQVQTFEWAKSMGSLGPEDGSSITTDASGNVYTTGYFQNTVDFDPGVGTFNLTSNGGYDIFIQKLDSNGNFLWAKSMGSTGSLGQDYSYSITIDVSGNVYTTGNFQNTVDFDPGAGTFNLTTNGGSDIFIHKLAANGNFIWVKSMGSTGGDFAYSITTDALGNVYTTGIIDNTVDLDPGAGVFNLTSNGLYDIFIQKLDSNGNFIWAKSMGSTGSDYGYSITTDASGYVYTTGHFQNTVDFDSGPGTFNLASNGSNDIFIQKLAANGNFIWAKNIGSTGNDVGRSISTDASGNVYTTGSFQNTVDFDPGAGTFNLASNGMWDIFIQKLDSNGNFIWGKSMGSTGNDNCLSITTDASSNVYTTGLFFQNTVDFDPGAGVFNLTSNGSFDVFIQKLDYNGNFIWAKSMGSTGNDIGLSITTDASGNVYATGYFQNTVDFNPGTGTFNLTSNGFNDIFIQKLGQCKPNAGTDLITACNSFLWIDGNTYTVSNNTATDTLTNDAGCDSVVTMNLTITNSTSSTDTQTACDSFLWIDGNTYTVSNNTATDTLNNAAGCDSLVTLNLTITNSTISTDTQTACDFYLWIDGNNYTASNNTATHTLSNAAGCDSLVTLDLTINTVDSSVSQNGITLTAAVTGATYQWLNCNNNYAIISGETNQIFTASANGSYALEITQNGCIDTSACYSVTDVGIIENNFGNDLLLYPNPTDGNFSIDLGSNYQTVTITMTDVNGTVILSKTYNESQLLNLKLDEPAGVYLLIIESKEKKAVIKLIKE